MPPPLPEMLGHQVTSKLLDTLFDVQREFPTVLNVGGACEEALALLRQSKKSMEKIIVVCTGLLLSPLPCVDVLHSVSPG